MKTFIIYEVNVEVRRCEVEAADADDAERLYLDGDEGAVSEKKWVSNDTLAYEVYDDPDCDPVKRVQLEKIATWYGGDA